MIERKHRRLLWKYQNYYYVSNLPYNAEKLQFFHNEVGPIVTAAHIFIDKMDCAIQYERQGTCFLIKLCKKYSKSDMMAVGSLEEGQF